MTLLYGTITESQVEISADGLSIQKLPAGRPSGEERCCPGRTTLQKIFLVEHLAVAQHGTNCIGKRTIKAIGCCGDWKESGVPDAIQEAAKQLGSCVMEAAKAAGEKKLEGGLWVAGLSRGSSRPECHRIDFPRGKVEPLTEECFADGKGKDSVTAWSFEHSEARSSAEKAQEARRGSDIANHVFDGHTHSVVITAKDGPVWGRNPKHGTLGCEELLGPAQSAMEQCNLSEPPSKCISSAMKRLKEEHFLRVNMERGRHPTKLKGFEENLPRSRPDWRPDENFYKLIAIGNEAEIADECDVSPHDALLYMAHVQDLIESLPPPL